MIFTFTKGLCAIDTTKRNFGIYDKALKLFFLICVPITITNNYSHRNNEVIFKFELTFCLSSYRCTSTRCNRHTLLINNTVWWTLLRRWGYACLRHRARRSVVVPSRSALQANFQPSRISAQVQLELVILISFDLSLAIPFFQIHL